MKKVYVLGAGASKEAKLPLIKDFNDNKYMSTLKEVIRKREGNVIRYNDAKGILDLLRKEKSALDIEDALGHLSCSEYLDVNIELDNRNVFYAEDHKLNLEWLIVQGVSLRNKRPPKFYEKFFKKVFKENSTIISFNYDLLPERSVKKGRKEFDYGFADEYESSRGKLPLLLKLHGSIDWMLCDNCGLRIMYGEEVAIKITRGEAECPKCGRESGLSPVIIPPIIGKEEFLSEYTYGRRNIRDVWQVAREELSSANEIIFIGYSFRETDVYARNLFTIANLMRENDKKYIIVNPNPVVNIVYSRILPEEKLVFIPKTFGEYWE